MGVSIGPLVRSQCQPFCCVRGERGHVRRDDVDTNAALRGLDSGTLDQADAGMLARAVDAALGESTLSVHTRHMYVASGLFHKARLENLAEHDEGSSDVDVHDKIVLLVADLPDLLVAKHVTRRSSNVCASINSSKFLLCGGNEGSYIGAISDVGLTDQNPGIFCLWDPLQELGKPGLADIAESYVRTVSE
ncbi:hypothetical protein HJFPF1_05647 [Paramyrothecium foliicola]|nr:hypothetical protein HJFPF1_05647 [Paramyrothecium foliicola]